MTIRHNITAKEVLSQNSLSLYKRLIRMFYLNSKTFFTVTIVLPSALEIYKRSAQDIEMIEITHAYCY